MFMGGPNTLASKEDEEEEDGTDGKAGSEFSWGTPKRVYPG